MRRRLIQTTMDPKEAAGIASLAFSNLTLAEVSVFVDVVMFITFNDSQPISSRQLKGAPRWRTEGELRKGRQLLRRLVRKGKLLVTDEGLLDANPRVIEAVAMIAGLSTGAARIVE